MYIIYQYKCLINGHMYIGLTNNLHRRDREHSTTAINPNRKDYNQAIHKAIRKYGRENFELNVLEENIKTLEKAKGREVFWINFYNSYEDKKHYNETPGGDCPGEKSRHLGEEHPCVRLTQKDVEFCRQAYKDSRRSRDIWNNYYSDRITYAGFLRMWHGRSWKNIMSEVFDKNPHPGKYTEKDRDIIKQLFKDSGLGIKAFSRTKECYVGFGTLWNMINNPDFYNNK